MKPKNIWHLGAWNRNYGDYVLQEGLQTSLQSQSNYPLNFVPIDCQKTWFHEALIDKLNAEADLLLVGGGGLIFNRPEDSSHSAWQFNIKLEDLDKIKVPLVVYAIGYNKFFYDSTDFKPQLNAHLKHTQQKSELFSVRNQGTRQELIKRQLDPERIEVIPDSGMFASASPIKLPGLSQSDFKIGLNWAGDRISHRFPEPAEETSRVVIKNLCESLLGILERFDGGKVVFLSHIQGLDTEDAEVFAQYLGSHFYNLETEMPYLFPPSPAQTPFLIDIYKQMDLVIGMRGHSNIISFGMNIPFVALGSHNKNQFFLEEIGETQNFIDVRNYPRGCSADEMAQVLERVLADQDLKARMAQRFEQQKEIARAFNQRVLNLLG